MADQTGVCLGFKWSTALLIILNECLIIASVWVGSKNSGSKDLGR